MPTQTQIGRLHGGMVGDQFHTMGWQATFQQTRDMLGSGDLLIRSTVSQLPTSGNADGTVRYATNGRKVGEGAGAGTGVPVYWSNSAWRVFSNDAAVAA